MTDKKYGSIKLILGCMFSGKTTLLQREYHEWSSINKKILCINYIDDNRYGDNNNMYNHNKESIECIKVRKLEDINNNIIENSDIIIINEGQFFSDLIEFCLLWCEKMNKNIIVGGLDGDFKRRPFGKILDLIPYADSVEKLTAYCKKCSDGTKALFTHRTSSEKNTIVIGGSSNYEALCRYHYNNDK